MSSRHGGAFRSRDLASRSVGACGIRRPRSRRIGAACRRWPDCGRCGDHPARFGPRRPDPRAVAARPVAAPACLAAWPGAFLPSPLPNGLRSLTRCVRGEIARALDAGHDWQTVIDALRPFTQDLWRGLSETERAQFRRHLCTWWDVHRHRMAPRIADRIEAAQAFGQLRVHAGESSRST